MVITETRTFINNSMKVIRELPFKNIDYVEPNGLSGGILLLWDDRLVEYKVVLRGYNSIHSYFMVINTTIDFDFSAFIVLLNLLLERHTQKR